MSWSCPPTLRVLAHSHICAGEGLSWLDREGWQLLATQEILPSSRDILLPRSSLKQLADHIQLGRLWFGLRAACFMLGDPIKAEFSMAVLALLQRPGILRLRSFELRLALQSVQELLATASTQHSNGALCVPARHWKTAGPEASGVAPGWHLSQINRFRYRHLSEALSPYDYGLSAFPSFMGGHELHNLPQHMTGASADSSEKSMKWCQSLPEHLFARRSTEVCMLLDLVAEFISPQKCTVSVL